MKLSPFVRESLSERLGHAIRVPADCEQLALDIESVTGEHLGVNTMKRLLGFLEDERNPRTSTLDVIASYLGYENWETLCIFDDKSNSSFDAMDDELRLESLSVGQLVRISYLPDRWLIMKYQGDCRFIVLSAENSKLCADDELIITHIVSGYPLYVSEVKRKGKTLGSFTAGKSQGINFERL